MMICALVLAALIQGGCGGGGDKPATGRDDDFAKYSATDVQKLFKDLTGAELERGTGASETLDTLNVPFSGSSEDAARRYGGFIVLVTGNKSTLEVLTKKPPIGGRKIIDNVIIEGTRSSSEDDEGFQRAVQVLSNLGKPGGEVRLPPEETPCQKAGIDPEGGLGKQGVCKDGQTTVTVANAANGLKVEGRTLSGLSVKSGKTLVTRRYGLTRRFRAKGTFIVASFKVTNTGREPLDSLRPNLLIDGKRYSEDESVSFDIGNPDTFPIQPGDSGRVSVLFDVPLPAARKAVSNGAVEISGEASESSPKYADKLGRLRLAGAERGGKSPLRGQLS